MKQKIKYLLSIPLGYFILSLSQSFGNSVYRSDLPAWSAQVIYMCLDIFAVAFLVYLYNRYILKGTWSELSVCRPLPRPRWIAAALILSFTVLGCCILLTDGTWTSGRLSTAEALERIFDAVLYGGICAGVTEEMIFRGLMLGSLEKACGTKIAIPVSAFCFAVMHYGNIDPTPGNVVSLLVSITVIGCAFALITKETGSIWSAALFHGLYNLISGDMDIVHIASPKTDRISTALWTYTTDREYRRITGIAGSEDIETGLPALIGFALMIFLALYWIKKKQTGSEAAMKKRSTQNG